MHKKLTKNDCNVLVDVFSKLKTVLPYESVRNMGILKGYVKQSNNEEKDLIESYKDDTGKQYLYRLDLKGKYVPIPKPSDPERPTVEGEPVEYFTKAEYDAMSDEAKTEIFFNSKDLIYHEVPPAKFEEFSEVREKLLLTELDEDVRRITIKESTLKTISDNLVNGAILNKNNLKENLGDCILLLEDFGYIEQDK